jgi:hypothetical protein
VPVGWSALSTTACVVACLLAPCPPALRAQVDERVSVASAVYVRADSDRTTVVTPRFRIGAPVGSDTRVDVVYTVDVWSSASIDIRTAASLNVTEQRDELDVTVQQALADATLGATYRYSVEHDYTSHGGTLFAAYDLAQHNTTLFASLHASLDDVGRAGDAAFSERAGLLSGRLSITQVLDTHTLAQLTYELMRQDGYLSSPYRYVRISDNPASLPTTCHSPGASCQRENNPSERVRHALAIHLRRALTDALSVGASYRFYRDDWDLQSHTAALDIQLSPGSRWLLSLGYRVYHQTSASHYRPSYGRTPFPGLRTSDKELSSLTSNRLEFEVARTFEVDAGGAELSTVLLAAPGHFRYHDFPLLTEIQALEMTLALELKL